MEAIQSRRTVGFKLAEKQRRAVAGARKGQTHRDRYDQRAVDLGYSNLEALIAATWELSNHELASMLNVSETAANYVRGYGPPSERPKHRDLRMTRRQGWTVEGYAPETDNGRREHGAAGCEPIAPGNL